MTTVLIMGGTAEARALAGVLCKTTHLDVITSLAGRVRNPRMPEGMVWTGGFGGADGLATWLRKNNIDVVVDATHPFAARISSNTDRACRLLGVPMVCLVRPAWVRGPHDRWIEVPTVEAAASAAQSAGLGTVFLTVGRTSIGAFASLCAPTLLRCIDPPDEPLPRRCEVLLARGPFELESEIDLMTSHRVTTMVTKNSGGSMTRAKIDAAARLGVEVVMISRPPAPLGRTVLTTVQETATAVVTLLSGGSDAR